MKPKRIVCISAGAGTLKLGEFGFKDGEMELQDYALAPLGLDGAGENRREKAIREKIRELREAGRFGGNEASVCLSAAQVVTKIVKLPPVEGTKVRQIIQYEAQQNLPYPLEEAVWDFQILGVNEGGAGKQGELEVLLAGAKAESVEAIFRVAEANGIKPGLVDAGVGTLLNSFRFNYPEETGCSLIVEIGSKNTTVAIVDGERSFVRALSGGGNQITNEFGSEMKLRWAEAEKGKVEFGMVSLGGAYDEPEKREEAVVAKIARQFMTRLHVQVQQTMQYHRQQGGRGPAKVYLAGGGSLLPYTREFFAEKLSLEVEYFNPLRRMRVGEGIKEEELAKVAPALSEVSGMALRAMAICPVELNLLPKSLRQKQEFSRKRPYFVASVCGALIGLLAQGIFYQQLEKKKRVWHEETMRELAPLEKQARELEKQQNAIRETKREIDRLTEYLEDEFTWGDRVTEMRRVLLGVEESWEGRGAQAGVWIDGMGEILRPPEEGVEEVENVSWKHQQIRQLWQMSRDLARRYYTPEEIAAALGEGVSAEGDKGKAEGSAVTVRLRAVNLNSTGGKNLGNSALAYDVAEAFKQNAIFSKEGTKLEVISEPAAGEEETFTFGMRLEFKGRGKERIEEDLPKRNE